MQRRVFLTDSGLIPPFPADPAKTIDKNTDGLVIEAVPDADKKNYPSKLLSLIRSLEKKERGNDDYEVNIQETVDLFNHLIAVYSRHGLLRGDSEKADVILSSENSTASRGGVENRKRSGKKGKKGNKNNNSDDLRIQQNQNGAATSESSISQQQDEALIFTAILRIFTPTASNNGSKKMSNANKIDEDQALLISLAAELCLAICQHIKVDKESDACNLAEYELLAQSGKPILSGLVNTMKLVEYDMRVSSGRKNDDKCLTLVGWDEQIHISILNSSIKLACSLVSLFGTKLSRSTALLLDVNAISWKLLTVDNDSVQESAARLLSCLPLAGGIDRKSPSDIWSAQISDTLTALSTVLETMAPLTKTNGNSSQTEDSSNGATINFLGEWINFVRRDISDESFRLRCFYRFSRGLTKIIHFLLLQDGLDRYHSSSTLVDAQIDIKNMLAVVESFVSFPLSAETVYYRTKRRLRNENVDNGLLSPRIIATEVANHIKLMGHDILDCALAAVGGPALLPYARRILRISYASILTSSSGPVRKVMDPISAAQLEGKKRRWLHLSVASRAFAIQTFGSAIVAFGSDNGASLLNHSKSSSTSTRSLTTASTDGEKAITLVVGSLIEQISNNKIQTGDYDDDWGTSLERIELISASALCVGNFLVSCGGFVSIPIRSLIESVVVNALSKMGGTRQSNIQILTWAPVKVSILRLACSCVTTPWQDGASSPLVDLLITTASRLKHDVDIDVSVNAKAALRICDTIAVPRAPALTYVARAVPAASNDTNNGSTDLGPSSSATTDAALLATNIESARNDAVKARKKTEEMEQAKKRKVEERRQREEKGKHEKAAKRQKALAEKKSKKPKEEPAAIPVTDTAMDQETATIKPASKDKPTTTNDMSDVQVHEDETNKNDDGDNNVEGDVQTNQSKTKVVKEDAMETDQKSDDGSNNNSDDDDDDAFPEIFDGGPDSDDE